MWFVDGKNERRYGESGKASGASKLMYLVSGVRVWGSFPNK